MQQAFFASAGENEEVYRYVSRAVAEGSPLESFESDPAFLAYKDDPQFRAILDGIQTR